MGLLLRNESLWLRKFLQWWSNESRHWTQRWLQKKNESIYSIKKVLTMMKQWKLSIELKGDCRERGTKVFMTLEPQSDMADWQSKIEEKQTSHTACLGQTQREIISKRHERKFTHLQPRYSQYNTATSVQSVADEASSHLAQTQLTVPSTMIEMCSCLSTFLPSQEVGRRDISRVLKPATFKISFWIQIDMALPAVKIFSLISCYFLKELKKKRQKTPHPKTEAGEKLSKY